MIETIIEYNEKYNLIHNKDKIIVGVSGGADSIALLHILKNIQERFRWNLSLFVVHVNHKLRKDDAERDALFVKNLCIDWGIPYEIREVEVKELAKKNKRSLEEMAREVRYDIFEEKRKEMKYEKIAVAHHKNDQAETILMHLIRGAGVKGMIGMLPQKDYTIRPMLCVEKKEILTYCRKNQLIFCEDKTNYEDIYTRNKIRLKIIPILEEINPKAVGKITDLGILMEEEEEYLLYKVNSFYNKVMIQEDENRIKICKELFLEEHPFIQKRCIRFILSKLKGNLKNIELKHINIAQQFISLKQTGKEIQLPQGLTIRINYDSIHFHIGRRIKLKEKYELFIEKEAQEILIPNTNNLLKIEYFKNTRDISLRDKNSQYIDASELKEKLSIRNRKEGDLFFPLGSSGKKKLKDYFIDKKIPLEKRDEIPLLCHKGEIISVIGYSVSEKYKIKNETKEIWKLTIKENHNTK